jgi:hypothetical protein
MPKADRPQTITHTESRQECVNAKRFEFYKVKGIDANEAGKLDINELPIENTPFISDADTNDYYWSGSKLD